MLPLDEALARVDTAVAMRPGPWPMERVPLEQTLGRCLAIAPVARMDQPPFDKSAMDGFALRAGDPGLEHSPSFPGQPGPFYRVSELLAAGRVAQAPLQPGQALRIMTGAPVPTEADRVVMQEHTELRDGWVRVTRADARSNICPQGEDQKAGQPLLPAGQRLAAVDLANLAANGITELEVARRVRLAVISTGDEVVDHPDKLGPGRILDANGPLLASLAATWGLELCARSHAPDEPEATRRVIAEALEQADLVALSGGVSAGVYDHVQGALRACGFTIEFDRLAVKPGRPMTFAHGPAGLVFGLPGNPVPVYLMFHLFVLRAAVGLMGAPSPLRRLRLPLAAPFARRKTDRLEYVPARIDEQGHVERVQAHGTAHLLAQGRADGFFAVPRGVSSLSAHQPVELLLLRP
jgi:molybdopterin molybdotransferase